MKIPARLIIAVLGLLLALPARATPDPAVHLKLRLVGFNRWHYFTAAEVWVQPGLDDVSTTYRYILVHNWDGTIAVKERQQRRLSFYVSKYGISRRWRERALPSDRVREREGVIELGGRHGDRRLFSRQQVEDLSLSYRLALKEVLNHQNGYRPYLVDNILCGLGRTIEAKRVVTFRGRSFAAIETGSWDGDVCSFAFPVPVGR
jgi:hypothetical protein